jgi:diaminohydroxyphosphoribosylaminopyrimidine deaminase/5-amino-6-(5-phosphoribosylamino)uracil reductase
MSHSAFMEKALDIAFSRIGLTSPNPPVGAVIVNNGEVIASGGTQPYGKDHAEVAALKQLSAVPPASSMYVTLEPCCHYGKTPPCTNAIINSGIKKVFIGAIDPNPLVSGKGIQSLKQAGIHVKILDEYTYAAQEIIRPFSTLILKGRPHILHKSAMTLDGCTASRTRDSKWISSEDERALVHRMRSIVDAVIIGKGTYIADNPTLNVRQTGIKNETMISGKKSWYVNELITSDFSVRKETPLRVIIGKPDDFSNKNLFFDDNYLIFCYGESKTCAIPDYINEKNICDLDIESKDEMLPAIMGELKNRGVMFCMLEGGAGLASEFYRNNYIDEIAYFYAPTVLGGGYPLFKDPHSDYIRQGLSIKNRTILFIGTDIGIFGTTERA